MAYASLFSLVIFSKELGDGILNGMNICVNLVIPSLFMFMILANIICNSSLAKAVAKPFSCLANWIFRIDESYISIVVLSLIGGYPIGAKLISNAVLQNKMSAKTGEKMLAYCVNCGPAFLITAVGVGICHNIKVGIAIYISQIVACLAVGFIMSFSMEKTFQNGTLAKTHSDDSSLSSTVVNAVTDAIHAMVIVCGFIIAFSAFLPILQRFFTAFGAKTSAIAKGLLEVTSGCNQFMGNATIENIMLITVFTAFGGICVHLQIAAMLSKTSVKLGTFFAMRFVYIIVSVTIMWGITLLFPSEMACTISPISAECIALCTDMAHKFFIVSPIVTAFLILLSIMLLFYSKKSDRIK